MNDHLSIDGQALARQIEGACNEFEASGYSVVSIMSKINGHRVIGLEVGAGWSYTAGAIVVARPEG